MGPGRVCSALGAAQHVSGCVQGKGAGLAASPHTPLLPLAAATGGDGLRTGIDQCQGDSKEGCRAD